MIGILIGVAGAVLVNLAIMAYGYGKLVQTVKEQPEMMRMVIKIEIQAALDRHLAQYRHEERELTSPGRQIQEAL